MEKFWKILLNNLESNNSVVLLVVVKSNGSTPGRQGFKMMISEDSSQYGTIGGGIMERNFITLANSLFNLNSNGFTLKKQIHHKYAPDEQQSGLICSGEEWVVYGLIKPSADNVSLFRTINDHLEKEDTERLLFLLTPKEVSISTNTSNFTNEKRFTFNNQSENDWTFSEDLYYKDTLYILGGGHVGLALSKVFSLLDFYTIVIDNRAGIETIKKNDYANKQIKAEYTDCRQYIKEGSSTYVIVVTTSVQTDIEALASCIDKQVAYIGVMGSRSKKKEIYNQLSKKGISNELIQKIKCPIGIEKVKTHTAEEIAVSVATEIIKVKNENL